MNKINYPLFENQIKHLFDKVLIKQSSDNYALNNYIGNFNSSNINFEEQNSKDNNLLTYHNCLNYISKNNLGTIDSKNQLGIDINHNDENQNLTLTSNFNQKQQSQYGKYDALNLFSNLNKSITDFHSKYHNQSLNFNKMNQTEDLNQIQKHSINMLLNQECSQVLITSNHGFVEPPLPDLLILCGSFNPVHHGHLAMVEHAMQHQDSRQPVFEIGVTNCDKGTISQQDLKKRILNFRKTGGNYNILLTNKPQFQQKVKLLNEKSDSKFTFLMGSDTFERLFMLKQQESESNRKDQLRKFLEICNIEVLGRKSQNKNQCTNEFIEAKSHLNDAVLNGIIDVNLASKIKCQSENDFRIDISSSEIRKNQGL